MKRTAVSVLLLFLVTSPALAQQPDVATVMSRDLAGSPGREVVLFSKP